uniref:eIF-4F 25 kDa subunit n=1 Tax=Steinernema glaseri TaxID=37863 RepID=A0A1I7YH21_9BILA
MQSERNPKTVMNVNTFLEQLVTMDSDDEAHAPCLNNNYNEFAVNIKKGHKEAMLIDEKIHFSIHLPPHQLESAYSFWFLRGSRGDRQQKWEDCLRELVGFDTVEGFWSVYNHVQAPSKLPYGSDYYVFKRGIKPTWEDESNVKGGRWIINIERLNRDKCLNTYWMEVLIAMIGEQLPDSEYICGMAVSCRNKGDKISVWTRYANKDEHNLRIGMKLKEVLGLPDSELIQYVGHKAASSRAGSRMKVRLTLPQKRSGESAPSL